MYGPPRSTGRRSARRSGPYYNQAAVQYSTAANLAALANSGQLSWMTSPIGLQVQQPYLGPVPTAGSRRGGRIGGFNIQIPSSLAGIVPGAGIPSGPSLLNPWGQFTPTGPEAVKDVAMWKGWTKLKTYLTTSPADIPMVKEGKVEISKLVDTTIDTSKQLAQKDKILAFTNKSTDQWSEILSPEFGRVSETEPVSATYPSPMHYVEAMRIASLSSQPMNIGIGMSSQALASPCDDARSTIASLAMQPHASIIKQVASACDAAGTSWFKSETARGRFWFYLWLGLWAKYTQNTKYAGALVSTGNKLLLYYDEKDEKYALGKDSATGSNAVGFLLMFIRAILAAGWGYNRGAPINPSYLFDKWIKPAIDAVYDENGAPK